MRALEPAPPPRLLRAGGAGALGAAGGLRHRQNGTAAGREAGVRDTCATGPPPPRTRPARRRARSATAAPAGARRWRWPRGHGDARGAGQRSGTWTPSRRCWCWPGWTPPRRCPRPRRPSPPRMRRRCTTCCWTSPCPWPASALGWWPPTCCAKPWRASEELPREVLLQRVQRFQGLAVLRPDGYLAWALTGADAAARGRGGVEGRSLPGPRLRGGALLLRPQRHGLLRGG